MEGHEPLNHARTTLDPKTGQDTVSKRIAAKSQSCSAAKAAPFRPASFLLLFKPRVMLLVLFSGATALILEGSFLSQPMNFAIFLVALFLTGGSANALNQYFEREIDSRMSRTVSRRPLPSGLLTPRVALAVAVIAGICGVGMLWVAFNIQTAALALSTVLFYGIVYTRWLKPTTPQGVVIGGLAGAIAPIGAWLAATGDIGIVPVIITLIIFFWTPPHFWSLAVCFADDYKRVGLPMLPVVKGIRATLRSCYYYSLVLFGVTLLYLAFGGGPVYAIFATGLGIVFLRKVHIARQSLNHDAVWRVFAFSIIYLFSLLLAMIVDKFTAGLIV